MRRRSWTRHTPERVLESGRSGPEDHVELLDGKIDEPRGPDPDLAVIEGDPTTTATVI